MGPGGGVAALPAVAVLATELLHTDPDELRAALRRVLLVLAAGGDPHRDLEVDAPAVRRLADELDTHERREALAAVLDALRGAADGLAGVTRAVDALTADPGLALRWIALALLAEELSEGDG